MRCPATGRRRKRRRSSFTGVEMGGTTPVQIFTTSEWPRERGGD
jgi:hypothetical protein